MPAAAPSAARPATPTGAPVGDEFGAGKVLARIRASARQGFANGAHELAFEALGTRCRVSFGAPSPLARRLHEAVLAWIAHFEARYSRFLPDSLISRINRAAGQAPVAIDPDTERLFALCDQMHFITRGTLDPSALPLVRLWNWKAEPPVVPDAAAIEAARQLCGWRKVQRQPGSVFLPVAGMGLDLGGMGKEFAVDQVAELLAAEGASGILVDFGADVRVIGSPPDGRPGWHVGLDDPRQPGRCWCGLGLREGGVATSGDYVRNFVAGGRRYGHILDVRTGRPVENGCLAVSVFGPNCTFAGMLSTAAFVLGPEEGLRLVEAQLGVEAAILTERGTFTSRRFQAYVAS